MNYLRISDKKLVNLRAIRRENPFVSLSRNPDEATLVSLGYSRVYPTPKPSGDVISQGKPDLGQDGKWYQTWEVREFTEEELQQQFEREKAELIQAATDRRWQVMTGGMMLPSGIRVGTDIDDQNRITSVVANAELAGLTDSDEVDFKAASGWVRITIAQVKQIAGAIGQHVQACYSAERAHHEAIEALETREEVAEYDVGVGWPETQPETEPT